MSIIKFDSAEDMRTRAEKSQIEMCNKIRDNIKKSICAAADKGEFDYLYSLGIDNKDIPEGIIKELVDAGYNVDQEHRVISWI